MLWKGDAESWTCARVAWAGAAINTEEILMTRKDIPPRRAAKAAKRLGDLGTPDGSARQIRGGKVSKASWFDALAKALAEAENKRAQATQRLP